MEDLRGERLGMKDSRGNIRPINRKVKERGVVKVLACQDFMLYALSRATLSLFPHISVTARSKKQLVVKSRQLQHSFTPCQKLHHRRTMRRGKAIPLASSAKLLATL